MSLSRKEKRRLLFYRKVAIVSLVLAIGLFIVNMNSPINLFASMVADEQDYQELAAKLETYIVAEYEREKQDGDVDLAGIVKEAKKLNTLGLTITYNDGYFKSVGIIKELDTKILPIKNIELE